MSTYVDNGGSNNLTVSKDGVGGFNVAVSARRSGDWLGMTLTRYQAAQLIIELTEATK